MSGRHRKTRFGSEKFGTSKAERSEVNRKARHRANTELHLASTVDDHDDLVFTEPRNSGQRLHAEGETAAVATSPRKVRHWKQPFWKRRKNETRRRAEMLRELSD
jgi:hypothetical protein